MSVPGKPDLAPYLLATVACHTTEDLAAKVALDRPLRVKLGVDPSSPDLHLGHAVQLRYLRRMQALGHLPVLIIGDATAMVGDPTGKNATRPQLGREQVDANAATYLEQAGVVLDLERCEIVRNSQWFDAMGFMEAIRMGAHVTVARMLERDTFETRHKAGVPIGLHEFLYPLMQARDSVEVRADIEIGGTDQTFNLLMGRDFMRDAGLLPQVAITLPLLVGIDGEQKMSKSLGNAIGLTDSAREMFGRTMSIPDGLMGNWFELVAELPADEVVALLAGPPRDCKAALAREVVAGYHGRAAADEAAAEFDRMFQQHGLPDDIPETTLPTELCAADGAWVVAVMRHLGLAGSGAEARRLIAGGGVRLDGRRVEHEQERLPPGSRMLLQVGKRRFHRVEVPQG